jgi:hypothetical protein
LVPSAGAAAVQAAQQVQRAAYLVLRYRFPVRHLERACVRPLNLDRILQLWSVDRRAPSTSRRAPSSYILSGKQMEEAMGMLIIRHKVKDYDQWRPMFDKHSLMQQAAGLSNPRVFRSADDKSEIVVVFDTKDTERAKDFAASPDLRETMAKAGVMDDPTIYFLESV